MTSEPTPECITDLIAYANRALIGEIRPSMRKISIQYKKDDNSITMYFYLDKPLNQEELGSDIIGCIVTLLCADFPQVQIWNEKVIVIPFPRVICEEGTCIYGRYENIV
jgi:hypothetical protein